MIIVNFSHPLTDEQQTRIEELTGRAITEIRDVPCQFDNAHAFEKQVVNVVDAVGLSTTAWQTSSLLVNPPAYAPIAAILIAELHGRTGYFPSILRIRPVAGSNPPQFEVAEIINLQAVRDAARIARSP